MPGERTMHNVCYTCFAVRSDVFGLPANI